MRRDRCCGVKLVRRYQHCYPVIPADKLQTHDHLKTENVHSSACVPMTIFGTSCLARYPTIM